jgi:hypothetical protein
MVLKERVMQLVEKEEENLLDTIVYGKVSSQPLLTLGSQGERGKGSEKAAHGSSKLGEGSSQGEEDYGLRRSQHKTYA